MPRMSETAVAVAANAVSTNRVAGQQYEFLDRPSNVLLAVAASAVGINATLMIGGIVVINDQPMSGANRFPILPDDTTTKVRAAGRVLLTFRNTTGGALTVNWLMDVG